MDITVRLFDDRFRSRQFLGFFLNRLKRFSWFFRSFFCRDLFGHFDSFLRNFLNGFLSDFGFFRDRLFNDLGFFLNGLFDDFRFFLDRFFDFDRFSRSFFSRLFKDKIFDRVFRGISYFFKTVETIHDLDAFIGLFSFFLTGNDLREQRIDLVAFRFGHLRHQGLVISFRNSSFFGLLCADGFLDLAEVVFFGLIHLFLHFTQLAEQCVQIGQDIVFCLFAAAQECIQIDSPVIRFRFLLLKERTYRDFFIFLFFLIIDHFFDLFQCLFAVAVIVLQITVKRFRTDLDDRGNDIAEFTDDIFESVAEFSADLIQINVFEVI